MLWIEQNMDSKFIDKRVQKNPKEKVDDDDYFKFKQIAKYFWLTEIKDEMLDLLKLPYTQKLKEWVGLLKEAINKQLLPLGFEVTSIDEQYLTYTRGGHYDMHVDTKCNQFKGCDPEWTLE